MELKNFLKESYFGRRRNKDFISQFLTYDNLGKNYSKRDTFINKSIIIIDTASENFCNDNHILIYSFEFAKFHLTSQNAMYIKEDSDIYKLFKQIDPNKTKKLKNASIPFIGEMLTGIHLTEILKVEKINILKTILEKAQEKNIDKIMFGDKEVYIKPISNLLKDEDCVLIHKIKANSWSRGGFNRVGLARFFINDETEPEFSQVY